MTQFIRSHRAQGLIAKSVQGLSAGAAVLGLLSHGVITNREEENDSLYIENKWAYPFRYEVTELLNGSYE